ncbi:PfkB family carbohydrate kinase [Nocardia sp. NPDC057353]|uniref:PfkB family carbohydrate kinase n=1 Tax=Nocardia sp. NPDC057353 TaxID=3346104 RepID=UPI00364483A2
MSGPVDGQVVAVRQILTRLGKRSGLSAERVRTTEIDVEPLLRLPAVRTYARQAGIDSAEAVLPVVREVARRLSPTDRLVVDAALALGLIEPGAAEVDTARLYAADLGERRVYLTEAWQLLHAALGARPVPSAPSVRTLRVTPEQRAFTALAAELVDDLARNGKGPLLPGVSEQADELVASYGSAGTVTVLGNAVVDHLYRTDRLPAEGISVRGRFEERIGGKGLNRAVAAARLGMEARLLAAIGDDDAGRRILARLADEDVDTTFVRTVAGHATEVAALIVTRQGAAFTIGADGDRVQLAPQDLLAPAVAAALVSSDVVVLTLESPLPVVEQALAVLRSVPRPPFVVLHAAPPPRRPASLYQFLDGVDFVVGNPRELDRLVSADDWPDDNRPVRDFDGEVALQLLALGVRTVCAIEGFACRLRGAHGDLDIDRPRRAVLRDAPGAHAAFCGALAYQLVVTGGHPDFAWVCAAMAATQALAGDVPEAMPYKAAIDRMVDRPRAAD